MYRIQSITFPDLSLDNAEWKLHIAVDDIIAQTVSVSVLFESEGVRHSRYMLLYDYSEAATWEDEDLYNALLALPELSQSEQI